MFYVSRSHLSCGLYIEGEYPNHEICDQCGESDEYLFSFEEDFDDFMQACEYEGLSYESIIELIQEVQIYGEEFADWGDKYIEYKEKELSNIKALLRREQDDE